MTHKPRMVAAISLASKMVRDFWTMMTKQEAYRNPVAMIALQGVHATMSR